MWDFFLDIGVKWGLPALILIFWYLHAKDQHAAYERQTAATIELFKALLDQNKEQSERTFKQTEQMIDHLQYLTGMISRVDTKVDGNNWCPIVRGNRGERPNG